MFDFLTYSVIHVSTVLCEECAESSDCVNTLCADGHNAVCEHPDAGGQALCTCATVEGMN